MKTTVTIAISFLVGSNSQKTGRILETNRMSIKRMPIFSCTTNLNENANAEYLPVFQDIEGQAQQEEGV